MFAKLAYVNNCYGMNLSKSVISEYIGEFDGEMQYLWTLYNTEKYLDCLPMAYKMKEKYSGDVNKINQIDNFINTAENNKKNRYRVL